MDRFERAMIDFGIPTDKINLIKNSPVWIERFSRYTRAEINSMIDLFPKIYITLNVPEQAFAGQAFAGQAFTGQAFTGQAFTGLKRATEAEFREARKKYVPMDMS